MFSVEQRESSVALATLVSILEGRRILRRHRGNRNRNAEGDADGKQNAQIGKQLYHARSVLPVQFQSIRIRIPSDVQPLRSTPNTAATARSARPVVCSSLND